MTMTNHETPGVVTAVGGRSASGFAVRWVHVNKPTKKETLAEVNRRLFANPALLLQLAEANTRRLTGQPRL